MSDMSEKTNDSSKLWDWYKIIPIILSFAALLFSICTYFDLKNEKNVTKSIAQHNQAVEDSLQLANSLFENAHIQDTIQLFQAFDIYKKMIKEKSSDMTGYNNFLNLAITRRNKLDINCDFWIKWYLLRAKELFDNKKVQDMLKQCEE